MSIGAGELRHSVAIDKLVDVRSPTGSGATTKTWVTFVAKTWAKITPASGREYVAAQSAQSKVTGRIVIRRRAGVTAKMRVRKRSDGTVYNIEAVMPDPESGQEYLTLLVSDGVTDGR
jgi:SPP1 family predicted phage head-tail adaptor